MTKIEQDHNKDTYPKVMLNKLKVMWDFTFIYTHCTPNLKKILKELPTYMWPMFPMCDPCAPMCGPCPSMWELIVNYELANNELKVS